jgi:hypothetical protein
LQTGKKKQEFVSLQTKIVFTFIVVIEMSALSKNKKHRTKITKIACNPSAKFPLDVPLEDILKKTGDEDLLDQLISLAENAEDDPPVIFGWENVERFAQAILTARRQRAVLLLTSLHD